MVINGKGKILILSGRFGEGHLQAAHAIKEAAGILYPNVESKALDFFEWAFPSLFPISHFVYMKGIKNFPQVYGYLYRKTYKDNGLSKRLNSLFSIGLGKMLTLLQNEKPSVVVSTYPFTSSIISRLKEYGLTNVPLVTVITDHTHHSSWIHSYTNQYIVGSKEIKEKLIQLGILENQIACTGIPIRKRFLESRNRNDLLAKYQLGTNVPTVLIMGGGEGLIGKDLFHSKELEEFPIRLQLIVLCGHNEKLKQHIKEELSQSKHFVKVMGYTDHVDELMTISDLIITKPGGVTTAEALAMQLPMLLYKPLPGQEKDNAAYLINARVAVQAANSSELFSKLAGLLENPNHLAVMKENAEMIQSKASAFRAIGIIHQSMENDNIFSVTPNSLKTYRQIKKSFMWSESQ